MAHPAAPRRPADDVVWDDRAEEDANQLVALLFVAAGPLRRADVAGTLRIRHGRLERACALLKADPPRGLRLEEAGDQLGLVSAPDRAVVIERHLGRPAPEPLSEAALHALAIVAYEQPVTRADIRAMGASIATPWSRRFAHAGWWPKTRGSGAAVGRAF